MIYGIKLKFDREKSIQLIKEQIDIFNGIEEISTINSAFRNLVREINNILYSKEIVDKLKQNFLYQENEYSEQKTKENIKSAKERVISFLEDIIDYINNNDCKLINNNAELPNEISILVLKRILNNFYMHIETMYEQVVHGKAGITKEDLNKLKIVNEYDVQRMLYSLIKPIFPEARTEVPDDAGFSGVRYDIFIERLSAIIEVKCSRGSMTEKSLSEEIGSDILHYKYNNIFFFIYDKEKIIKNLTAFRNTYNRTFDGKNVDTIIIQPVIL